MQQQPLAENITTIGEHNVQFPVDGYEDGTGYLTSPPKKDGYGLVMIQEVWGMNKSLTITANTFANAGEFAVLVVDLYKGKVATNREEAQKLKAEMNYTESLAIVASAVKWLKSNGCSKVGVVGFCMGGGITIATATQYDVMDAALAFYGVPDLTKYDLSKIKCPLKANFAEKDQSPIAGEEGRKKLEEALMKASIPYEIKVWPGVGHAFMNQDSPHYNEETAKEALADAVSWFKYKFGQTESK